MGNTLRQVLARAYEAMFKTLLGRVGKNDLGSIGTIKTASESKPFAKPYWNL